MPIYLPTIGFLAPILYGSFGWAAGAAMLTSNGKFQDGHAYQGCLGYIDSWFFGMYMFYLMFQYGLLAAILTHILYNVIVYLMQYVISKIYQ